MGAVNLSAPVTKTIAQSWYGFNGYFLAGPDGLICGVGRQFFDLVKDDMTSSAGANIHG